MNLTFLVYGEKKCPKCGTVGDRRVEGGIGFFECPKCGTAYTNEIVIATDDSELKAENN